MQDGAGNWAWAYCINPSCGYYKAVALAPFAIRWGIDASSDLIRNICAARTAAISAI
jgi:hypothetical protein